MSFIETKLRGKAASVFARRNSPPSKDMFKEESGNRARLKYKGSGIESNHKDKV